jgi:uncharacterized protein YbjT (DUF2867 family)
VAGSGRNLGTLAAASALGDGKTVNQDRTLLLGATSQIGVFAVPALVARGQTVMAMSRRPRPDWSPRWPTVSWVGPEDFTLDQAADCTGLLSCGPLSLVTHWLDRSPGIRNVVAFSTSSIASKKNSPDSFERQQIEAIAGQEEALREQCEVAGVRLLLLRPTLIYGCGVDRNISLLANWIRRFGFLPVARGARGLRQPVHALDLAVTAASALAGGGESGHSYYLAGGSTLSYLAMAERIFFALGRKPRILEVPAGVLASAVGAARLIPGYGGLSPEMVRRQGRDLVFDDAPAREAFGHRPREFHPSAEDFSRPGAARLRRLAGPGRAAD